MPCFDVRRTAFDRMVMVHAVFGAPALFIVWMIQWLDVTLIQ
jgi:hypothetical protein